MKATSAFLLWGLFLYFPLLAWGQGLGEDVISVPKLVRLCESCHGPSGVSDRDDVPSLAGQSVDSIMQSLEAFYFRQRHCPEVSPSHGDSAAQARLDMCNISASLSQVEKMALAEHFSARTPPQERE